MYSDSEVESFTDSYSSESITSSSESESEDEVTARGPRAKVCYRRPRQANRGGLIRHCTTALPLFAFANTAPIPATTTLGFNFGARATNVATSGFPFGPTTSTQNAALPFGATAPASIGFAFGATPTTTATSRFASDNTAPTPATTTLGGEFNFGAQTTTVAASEKEFVNCAIQREVANTVIDRENTKDENLSSLDSKEKEFVNCAVQTEVANNVINKENTKDEDWSSLYTKGVTLLSKRMKELLIKGRDHDLKISVKEKEFRAHRSILSARSPVFAMMLAHDTKENKTGTISIEDCDPESFDEFLLFVYSGRTENLTPSNALELYYSADKYDFPVLKELCVNMLKASLSVSSICDVVLLAARHQEKELLEAATEFFAQNLKEILKTVNWQNFMSENAVEANELYIKSMEILLLRK